MNDWIGATLPTYLHISKFSLLSMVGWRIDHRELRGDSQHDAYRPVWTGRLLMTRQGTRRRAWCVVLACPRQASELHHCSPSTARQASFSMSPISPADSNIVPRREFIRDQHPASSFSILALSGPALLRLYSFPPDAVHALRKHLDSAHLILGSREVIQNNFCEISLDGKPWSNPKSTRTEKLLIDILTVLYRNDYTFLSTLDYGREQDDRIVLAFSRPSSPQPPPAAPLVPFHKKSNDSLTVVSHPVKVPFAISFISQNILRVIAPPLHLTPAILQTVRGSWPRGVVSEKKVAENVYEFKFKGYGCNVVYLIDFANLTHGLPSRVQGFKKIPLQPIPFVTSSQC